MGKYRELAIRLENGDTVEEIADWLFWNISSIETVKNHENWLDSTKKKMD